MADCRDVEIFINEFARMCENQLGCKNCPLKNRNGTSCFSNASAAETIRIVQQWSDENPEIKKCPFCGDVAVAFKKFDEVMQINTYSVVCDGCGIGTGEYDIKAEAIALWNKRADVRKRGKLLPQDNTYTKFKCSACGAENLYGHGNFCIICGAQFGGASDE